ncbi:MAG: hypothetical protein HYV24_01850 [Deltaproteobacteria bacterium]|nr:hypothetical protein [Deltaproteobacteria bacterium]
MKNKKIVYFLGAGASKPFGIPLTNEILPQILQGICENNLFTSFGEESDTLRAMEQDLKKILLVFMPGLEELANDYMDCRGQGRDKKKKEKIFKKFPLITDVLSLIDYMAANQKEPSPNFLKKRKDMEYFRWLFDRAICEIVVPDEDYTNNKKEIVLLKRFAKRIREQIMNGDQVTLITSNYDASVEYELFEKFDTAKIDFGFSWRDVDDEEIIYGQPPTADLRIYKLHGSLNWLKCDLCEHIYINTQVDIFHLAFSAGKNYYNTCHCGNPLKVIMVAPSFEREVRDPNLLHIWKSAVQGLREADRWVMIEYSMPSEDLAIKSLLIRGLNSRRNKKDFEVEVVQKGRASEDKYSLMFGRNNLKFYKDGLEKYLEKVP